MPVAKDTLDFKILNSIISVKAGDDPERVQKIASYVKRQLEGLRAQSGALANPMQIALIGCMNLTEVLFDAQKEIAELKHELSERVKSNDYLTAELNKKDAEYKQLKEKALRCDRERLSLQKAVTEKNEELNQLNEQMEQIKGEGDSSRKSILSLQNQLFEAQIELSKYQKE